MENLKEQGGKVESFAVTMKAARINANLSQKAASEALGINKGTLSNYEAYKTIPDMEMGERMAKLYGCTVDNIIFYRKNRL